MKSKREFQTEVKQLIETDPNRSLEVCLEMYANYTSEFNNYDAVDLLKAARASKRIDIDKLAEILEKFKDQEIVSSLCGWYVFENFIKGKAPQEILNREHIVQRYISIMKQKDVSVEDKFPCAFRIVVFKLMDAHSNNLFNAKKIYDYCKKINPEYLSKKTSEYKDKDGKTKENPSPLETYYQNYTKACEKLNIHSETIEACEHGLRVIDNYHYDNDLWFKMRIARAYRNLKDYDTSERKYLEIINSRAGSTKYFLFQEYSDVLYKQLRYEESWRQSLRAGIQLYDVSFCSSLLLHQSRLLARLNRLDEAKKFAEIIFLGVQEKLWNNSSEYQKLINYFEIKELNGSAVKSFKKLYKNYKDELYSDYETKHGEIVFIHPRGKLGKIRYSTNESINFTKNSFNDRVRSLDKFAGATISFVIDYDYKSEQIAENIKIESLKVSEVVGGTFKGKIRNIVDFGIFIDMDNGKSGLAHQSTLSKEFKTVYKEGESIKVTVIKETEKGLRLKVNEK